MKRNLAEKVHPLGESLDLSTAVVNACADAKASDISVLSVANVSDLCEYFVIASGRSDRQVQGICTRVLEALEQRGITPISVEGFDRAHWIAIDCGDIVVHLFYEPVREIYDLESLWAKAEKLSVSKRPPNQLYLTHAA